MKKHFKSLLVLMLLVPCLIALSACGGGTYRLNAIRITEGETATTHTVANYKAKVKADYIKAKTGVTAPTPEQTAAAHLQYEREVLASLAWDFAESASGLFEKTFPDYEGTLKEDVKELIKDTLLAWNASGVGTAPTGTPTMTDYINAVRGTNMTTLADAIYAKNNDAFLDTNHDTESKAKAAIKATLDRLHISKTATLHTARIKRHHLIPGLSELTYLESVRFTINGNKMTIKLNAADLFGAMSGGMGFSEELYSGQAKIKIKAEMKITVNFTKDSNGVINIDDTGSAIPIGEMNLKMVGNTIEAGITPGVVAIFKK